MVAFEPQPWLSAVLSSLAACLLAAVSQICSGPSNPVPIIRRKSGEAHWSYCHPSPRPFSRR